MSHKKFGPDRFSRFDVYRIQTDRHTNKHHNRQAKFIYRLKTFKTHFLKIVIIHKPFLWLRDVPIGSAVLTFIGYKQTPRQAKFRYR